MSETFETLENITYDELQEGDSATYVKTLTEDELVLFAAVSGDVNPLHLDSAFAADSSFHERIAHGMWSGSLISAALATVMPGPGTVYLEQSLTFRRAVKLDDTLTVNLKVLTKGRRNRVTLACDVRNQNDEQVVTGEAKVIAPTQKMSLSKPRLPKITIER
ncbi:MaoC/PaaZ C-terminal domain-containing protein [Marinobacter sp. ATCH36]|uniref:MaoC/PaaZ C-terminal domain-containing protein n=1 Tax=Marinobacter sp. ATCH36 TaxID=2945106 RepID=UPI002021E67A|nr:MaoC/PaaZ C-terminal domain-containing protein [Marinobacter sp. ATCH36]MCL7944497.1 MaoC family dehydratase N-terminal domain-containing protein [Marinobacter sp. ATCH36]